MSSHLSQLTVAEPAPTVVGACGVVNGILIPGLLRPGAAIGPVAVPLCVEPGAAVEGLTVGVLGGRVHAGLFAFGVAGSVTGRRVVKAVAFDPVLVAEPLRLLRGDESTAAAAASRP